MALPEADASTVIAGQPAQSLKRAIGSSCVSGVVAGRALIADAAAAEATAVAAGLLTGAGPRAGCAASAGIGRGAMVATGAGASDRSEEITCRGVSACRRPTDTIEATTPSASSGASAVAHGK